MNDSSRAVPETTSRFTLRMALLFAARVRVLSLVAIQPGLAANPRTRGRAGWPR